MSVARNITEVAIAIIGLSLAGLLITNSGKTAEVIGAATGGFGDLLRAATAQNASFSR